MAGLVPAIYVFLASSFVRRGCRHKPGMTASACALALLE
jgi:hypothetical protein